MVAWLRKLSTKLCRRQFASFVAGFAFCMFLYVQYLIIQRQSPQTRQIQSVKRIQEPCPVLLNRSQVAIEQSKRRTAILDACRKYANSKWLDAWPYVTRVPRFDRSPLISSRHNLLYCVAAKVGSTYFSRWMKAIESPGAVVSPLEIPLSQAKRSNLKSLHNLGSEKARLSFTNSATKIVFGREPYSRVFSAYVDKLYSPNPVYWAAWGQRALKALKLPIQHCGSNVTFSQFVNLFFSNGDREKMDFHLIPVYKECKVCEMPYNVVGKLESLGDDLEFISEVINVSSSFLFEEKYKIDLRFDGMLDTVTSVFSWRKDIKHCMTMDETGKRLWRKFQIRGIIDSSIGYPLKPGQFETIDVDSFIETCKEAILKSTDKAKLKRQKRIALEEAYIDLTSELVESMQDYYQIDQALFGYSKKNNFLDDGDYRKKFVHTGVFNWSTTWNL